MRYDACPTSSDLLGVYRAFQVACNARTAMQLQHVIKLKLSSQLIGQFGHVTASASCKQPEKHGILVWVSAKAGLWTLDWTMDWTMD